MFFGGEGRRVRGRRRVAEDCRVLKLRVESLRFCAFFNEALIDICIYLRLGQQSLGSAHIDHGVERKRGAHKETRRGRESQKNILIGILTKSV